MAVSVWSRERRAIQQAALFLKRSDADVFLLSCACGWSTREDRGHVISRIRRHYAYPYVLSNEIVGITEVREVIR